MNDKNKETLEHNEQKKTKKNIIAPIISGVAIAALGVGMFYVGNAHQSVLTEISSLKAGLQYGEDGHDHSRTEDAVSREEQLKLIDSDEGKVFFNEVYDKLSAAEFTKDQESEVQRAGIQAEFNTHIKSRPKLEQFIYTLPFINSFQDELKKYDAHYLEDMQIEAKYFIYNDVTIQCDLLPKFVNKEVKAEDLISTYSTVITSKEDFDVITNFCGLNLDEKKSEEVYNEIREASNKALENMSTNEEILTEGNIND